MTTSVLDVEELKKHLSDDKSVSAASLSNKMTSEKPVSGQDLIERAKGLFTPEEANALGHRIEESCEQIDD